MATGTGHDATAELAAGLSGVLGGAHVSGLARLSGGASRETWRFEADGSPLILQRQRDGAVRPMTTEVAVLRAAHEGGVAVPEVVVDGGASTALGNPFMVVRAVEGETIARKILRDDEFSAARARLTADIGTAMARLHSLPPQSAPGLVEQDEVATYRRVLDDLGEPHPVFEVAFRWLEASRPASSERAIVHGDFRLGNVMVDGNGLVAVLDWELAHVGDPMEDLGWVCVKAWRFGGGNPVAGLGTYDELFDAYEAAGRPRPDIDVVRWWEVLGTLKWGIMCITQAASHLNGLARSHELAAIGRRVCENEWDLIGLLKGRV
ncbi:MAG: phosphotransferase family protein [Actinomycetes bacterium]